MKMPAWFPTPDRRPSLLSAASSGLASQRLEVPPPALRTLPGSPWQRLMRWLLAPAPHEAPPPLDRLPSVRTDFAAVIADIDSDDAERLRQRIAYARTLHELWHLRSDIYRLVGIARDQGEAERRLALLAGHFPTRSPRSQLAGL